MAGPRSAGLLLYRVDPDGMRVLLVHPGGPYWANKDDGSWSIPKGEYADEEAALAAARREFAEELGSPPPPDSAGYRELGQVKQAGGKLVTAWAVPGEFDVGAAVSNTVELEWPPRSGRRQSFPEVDRVAWFDLDTARTKLNPAQVALLDRLQTLVDAAGR